MAAEKIVQADGLLGWVDRRFPLISLYKAHLSEYYAPKNFNFFYFFGSLAMLVLVLQIVTGIFLVMHYKPDASLNAAGIPVAFASVEYIMREVPFGCLFATCIPRAHPPSSQLSSCTCSAVLFTGPTVSPANLSGFLAALFSCA